MILDEHRTHGNPLWVRVRDEDRGIKVYFTPAGVGYEVWRAIRGVAVFVGALRAHENGLWTAAYGDLHMGPFDDEVIALQRLVNVAIPTRDTEKSV